MGSGGGDQAEASTGAPTEPCSAASISRTSGSTRAPKYSISSWKAAAAGVTGLIRRELLGSVAGAKPFTCLRHVADNVRPRKKDST